MDKGRDAVKRPTGPDTECQAKINEMIIGNWTVSYVLILSIWSGAKISAVEIHAERRLAWCESSNKASHNRVVGAPGDDCNGKEIRARTLNQFIKLRVGRHFLDSCIRRP